jgi:hypothetical protein
MNYRQIRKTDPPKDPTFAPANGGAGVLSLRVTAPKWSLRSGKSVLWRFIYIWYNCLRIQISVPIYSFHLDSKKLATMEHIKLYARDLCNSKPIKPVSDNIVQLTRESPKNAIYAVLSIVGLIWFSVTAVRRLRSQSLPSRSRTPDLEKPQYARQNSNLKGKYAMEEPGGTLSHTF